MNRLNQIGRLGKLSSYKPGGSWSSYWTQQLSLRYSGRNALDIIEVKSGLTAKIIPSCGKIDASNYITKAIANFEGADASGFIEARFYFTGGTGTHILFSSNATSSSTRYFRIAISNKRVYLYAQSGVTFNNIIVSATDLTTGWRTVRFGSTESAYYCTVDGAADNVAVGGSGNDDGRWLNSALLASSRVNVNIGANITATSTYSSETFFIDYVNYNDEHKWIITGDGENVFDSIGTSHLSWVGAAHQAYNLNGSQDLMNLGYSTWAKAGSPNEYVPYKAGAANDVSAYLTGFSKLADYPGTLTAYNFAPSVVDFDYSDTTDASLVSFDKSNSTHHIATAGMSYFDAANVYRWRQDELAAPQIYSDTYKKVGYKGFWMIKGTVSGSLVKSFDELFVMKIDFIGNNQWKLAQECGLQDIVVQSEGQPVFDGDNYLTWI